MLGGAVDDALLRHELLRRTYLEAREDLVDVLIERIRHEIRRRFPEAEYLSLDSQVLDDGRLELKAAGLRSGRSLAVPTEPQADWEAVSVSITPFLDELGEVAALDEIAQGVLLA